MSVTPYSGANTTAHTAPGGYYSFPDNYILLLSTDSKDFL